jgi:hypothetical protein
MAYEVICGIERVAVHCATVTSTRWSSNGMFSHLRASPRCTLAEIPGGASTIVVLDGTGVQLGNNGGNLVLQDDHARQVDSVTYSSNDAATVDRYIRFQR